MDHHERARRLIDAFDELERRRQHEAAALREWVIRLLSDQDGSISSVALSGAHDRRDAPLLLDLDAAAGVLGVSVSTVKRIVSAGHLPAVKVLGSTRVRRVDLEQYVANLGTEGKTA